jgi:small subunit ribosomal protein S18
MTTDKTPNEEAKTESAAPEAAGTPAPKAEEKPAAAPASKTEESKPATSDRQSRPPSGGDRGRPSGGSRPPFRGRGGAGGGGGRPRGGKRFFKKKFCTFCAQDVRDVDYKDPRFLRRFVTERGKILPRRITGVCSHHQRKLAVAIKRSRLLAMLPFKPE